MQSLTQTPSPDRSSANDAMLHKQLPIWPESVRGGPNAILRSALFAGIHSKKRQILGTPPTAQARSVLVPIASQDGIDLKFAGTQFNQYDADLFFETVHRARRSSDTSCTFQGAELLRAIGRCDSKRSYDDLEQSLDRLRWSSVDIHWEANGRRYRFSGGLINNYIREETTKRYQVNFAKEILTLFAPASWTQLEWEERQALLGQPLAQWLHSYYSTHAAPFPVSVAFLHEKSGSPTTLLKHFKTELKKALAVLEAELGWTAAWKKQLVTVTRKPTGSQTRHIIRSVAKAQRQKALRQIQQHQLPLSSGRPAKQPRETGMSSTADILAALIQKR